MHRCDARVKIAVLLVYSIAIVFVRGWLGLLVLAALAVVATAVARIPARAMVRMLAPVLVLAAFSFAFNVVAAPGVDGVLSGTFVAVRMVALVAASFVVCLTSGVTDLVDAFAWFIGPTRRLHVPVDDIAFTLALSIRFIPVIERDLRRIRAAQLARGADAPGSLMRMLRIWAGAFASLFVGLFRHAGSLADAMDARCYGAERARTRLPR